MNNIKNFGKNYWWIGGIFGFIIGLSASLTCLVGGPGFGSPGIGMTIPICYVSFLPASLVFIGLESILFSVHDDVGYYIVLVIMVSFSTFLGMIFGWLYGRSLRKVLRRRD